jgi:non-ribosomal peptide synthetase component F
MGGSFLLAGEEYDHPRDEVISDLLESYLSAHPAALHQVAVCQALPPGGGDSSQSALTFLQLNARANQLARVLAEKVRQYGEEQRNQDGDLLIAVRFVPDPSLIVSLLAILKAGLAYVPIAPNWPELRIRHILTEAQPLLILTNLPPDIFHGVVKSDKEFSYRMPEVLHYADLEAAAVIHASTNLEPHEIFNRSLRGRRLLAVLYTSGSTGTPKGVRLLHQAALNRLGWYWRSFPYAEDEVCVFKTTLTFVDSIAEIWSPLLRGKQLIVFPRRTTQNVADFVEALDRYRIGRVYLLTGLMRSILAYVNLNRGEAAFPLLGSVRLWELTAEAVTKDVLLSFFSYFTSGHHVVSNFYGSTETMDVVLCQTFRGAHGQEDECQPLVGFFFHHSYGFVIS